MRCSVAKREERDREREEGREKSDIVNNIVLQQCVENRTLPRILSLSTGGIHDNEARHLRSFSAVITRTCISLFIKLGFVIWCILMVQTRVLIFQRESLV